MLMELLIILVMAMATGLAMGRARDLWRFGLNASNPRLARRRRAWNMRNKPLKPRRNSQ